MQPIVDVTVNGKQYKVCYGQLQYDKCSILLHCIDNNEPLHLPFSISHDSIESFFEIYMGKLINLNMEIILLYNYLSINADSILLRFWVENYKNNYQDIIADWSMFTNDWRILELYNNPTKYYDEKIDYLTCENKILLTTSTCNILVNYTHICYHVALNGLKYNKDIIKSPIQNILDDSYQHFLKQICLNIKVNDPKYYQYHLEHLQPDEYVEYYTSPGVCSIETKRNAVLCGLSDSLKLQYTKSKKDTVYIETGFTMEYTGDDPIYMIFDPDRRIEGLRLLFQQPEYRN